MTYSREVVNHKADAMQAGHSPIVGRRYPFENRHVEPNYSIIITYIS